MSDTIIVAVPGVAGGDVPCQPQKLRADRVLEERMVCPSCERGTEK